MTVTVRRSYARSSTLTFSTRSLRRLSEGACPSELKAEIAEIERVVAGIRVTSRPRRRPGRPRKVAGSAETSGAAVARNLTRRPMTAAQTKAVGERVRMRCAARRKAGAPGHTDSVYPLATSTA